jgi:hypothetical protein
MGFGAADRKGFLVKKSNNHLKMSLCQLIDGETCTATRNRTCLSKLSAVEMFGFFVPIPPVLSVRRRLDQP